MEIDNKYKIDVSDIAAENIKINLIKRGTLEAYIRLGVKGSGCSGYTYVIAFEDDPPRTKDLLFEINDVRIIVDIKSILYLNGCTLDWEQSLMNNGFKFINPREKSKCGCGSSFTI